MPFNLTSELELNFIWLGKPMPQNQLVNMLLNNPGVQLNIWVNSEELWNDFKKRMALIVNKFFEDNKAILAKKNTTKADIYRNLCPQKLTPESIQLPKELAELFQVFEKAGLWASISDIARLLILSRTGDPKARHARVYAETDNETSHEFWNIAFGKKYVGAIYIEEMDGKKLFPPETARGDCIFIDINSPQGKDFAANIRAHLLKLFADPMMAAYIKALKDHAEQCGGLHPTDVRLTFGMLFTAVLRMHFMTPEKETMFGMKDVIIPKRSLKGLIKHGCFGEAQSSWVQEDKPKLMRGIVSDLFSLQLAELSDVSGIIAAKMLVEAQKKFPNNKVETKKDYLNLLSMVLDPKNIEDLPDWFKITLEKNRAIATRPKPF